MKRHELDMVKNGKVIAYFVRRLNKGECSCKWENKRNYFIDSDKIFKKA
jgi:hypothetical protein